MKTPEQMAQEILHATRPDVYEAAVKKAAALLAAWRDEAVEEERKKAIKAAEVFVEEKLVSLNGELMRRVKDLTDQLEAARQSPQQFDTDWNVIKNALDVLAARDNVPQGKLVAHEALARLQEVRQSPAPEGGEWLKVKDKLLDDCFIAGCDSNDPEGQIVDGVWYRPYWGCDTLDRLLGHVQTLLARAPRDKLEGYDLMLDDCVSRRDKIRAVNDRLRCTLENIAANKSRQSYKVMAEWARAALKEASHG